LFLIRRLETAEHPDVMWLKPVGRVRGKSTESDIILMTKLHYFERFIGSEPIVDQDSRPMICSKFGLRIKDSTIPVQHDVSVAVPTGGANEMPSGYRISGPIAPMCRRRLDAGQMMSGDRHLPSAEILSTAVTKVHLTPAPLHFLKSSLWTSTFREVRTLNENPVSIL
jgi:hypothetical protein